MSCDPASSELTVDARGVARLTLQRPERHNAFDDQLIAQLQGTLEHLAADRGVRVVVLQAEGKSFSAGADVAWMARMAQYDHRANLEDAECLARLMYTLYTLPKPTVAKVQGAAIGGGVGLVACCDIAIASHRASFALSEVRLGLIPAVIGPFVVRALGERQARRYFLTAERFDAPTAHSLGLVHEVVTPEALETRVQGLVDTLLANGPRAMAAAKAHVQGLGAAIDGAVTKDSAERIAALRASPEGREGLAAFLEKRPPRWSL